MGGDNIFEIVIVESPPPDRGSTPRSDSSVSDKVESQSVAQPPPALPPVPPPATRVDRQDTLLNDALKGSPPKVDIRKNALLEDAMGFGPPPKTELRPSPWDNESDLFASYIPGGGSLLDQANIPSNKEVIYPAGVNAQHVKMSPEDRQGAIDKLVAEHQSVVDANAELKKLKDKEALARESQGLLNAPSKAEMSAAEKVVGDRKVGLKGWAESQIDQFGRGAEYGPDNAIARAKVISSEKVAPKELTEDERNRRVLRYGRDRVRKRSFPSARKGKFERYTASRVERVKDQASKTKGLGGLRGLGNIAGGGNMGRLLSTVVGGASAGGAGALAGAAGGPVVAAATAAAAVVAGSMKGLREGIEGLGKAAVDVAGNNGMGLLKRGVEGYASALEILPVQGKIMAEQVRLMAAPIFAMNEAANAFVARGKELEGYSAALASANAEADVRKLEADIREANATGSQIAELTTAMSRADTAFQDAITPLKLAILNKLIPLVESGTKMLEIIADHSEELTDIGLEAADVSAGFIIPGWNLVAGIYKWLGLKEEEDKKNKVDEGSINSLMQQIFDLQWPNTPVQAGPEIRTADGGLSIPVLS